MSDATITTRDRAWARHCETCPVCSYARRNQGGLVHWMVANVEAKICPFCRAYEKVHGRRASDPVPEE